MLYKLRFKETRPKTDDKSSRVNAVIYREVKLEFCKGFAKLTAGAFVVLVEEMVTADRSLYQALIEESPASRCLPPEPFPRVMRLKKVLSIELFNTLEEDLFHEVAT